MDEDTTFFRRAVAKLPSYWKLATIRCGIYGAIVGWGSFQTGVEGYASFDDMTSMQFWKLIGNICISILGVWLAFLDSTMANIRQKQNPPMPDTTAQPTKP